MKTTVCLLVLLSAQLLRAQKLQTTCQTASCKISRNLCYTNREGCSFSDVALNIDFFVFKNKEMFETNTRDEEFLKTAIVDLKSEDSRLVEFLQEELQEISFSQNTLKEQILQTGSGSRIRVKIETSIEIIVSARRTGFVEILDGKNDLKTLSTEEILEILKFVFEENPQALGEYLRRFKDDSLRTSVLYPESCGRQCTSNYLGLFKIWRRIVNRVFKRWNMKFRHFKNCDRKRWKMRQVFDRLVRRYPTSIKRQLTRYFKYIVIQQICKAF